MFTASTKKQNRVLLITLVVLLLSAAVLIAVTGGANKKTAVETDPPIESGTKSDNAQGIKIEEKTDNKSNAADDTFGKTKESASSDESVTEKSQSDGDDKSDDSGKKTSAESEADVEVSITTSAGSLPRFAVPVSGGIVLKGFSGTVPVFSYTMNDYRTHSGIDLACSDGSPIYAAADGTVCGITDDPMMGITVTIEHSGGAVTKYKGLSEDSLTMNNIGDQVACGQIIGAAGDTALIESAEEGHVHFELLVNGEAKDPAEYINVTNISEITED